MKRKNTVDFSEIFYFAEKEFNISWNECNDVLFDYGLIKYKGATEFDIEELEYNIEEYPDKIGYKVLLEFMKANKVKHMLVLGD